MPGTENKRDQSRFTVEDHLMTMKSELHIGDDAVVRLTADQRALEVLIERAQAQAKTPIPVDAIRDAIRPATDRENLMQRLADVYRDCRQPDLAHLLAHGLYAADVLGYATANLRLDVGGTIETLSGGRDDISRVETRCQFVGIIRLGSFLETINWARGKRVLLPEEYYGEKQSLARAMAFSIAGLAALEQLQQVADDSWEDEEAGVSFASWKAAVVDRDRAAMLALSPERLGAIMRGYLQGHFAHGRCEEHKWNAEQRPYVLYDAGNEPPVTGHALLDGFVARWDDPIWNRWSPPCGEGCRCRTVSLTERDARRLMAADRRRLRADPALSSARSALLLKGPEAGWDYNPCTEPTAMVRREINARRKDCDEYANEQAEKESRPIDEDASENEPLKMEGDGRSSPPAHSDSAASMLSGVTRDPTLMDRYIEEYRVWVAAGKPMTDEERRRMDDHLERTVVELGGPIPARFKHLQYLNERADKKRG